VLEGCGLYDEGPWEWRWCAGLGCCVLLSSLPRAPTRCSWGQTSLRNFWGGYELGDSESVELAALYIWDRHRALAVVDEPTRPAKEGACAVARRALCTGQYYSSGPTALKKSW